MAEEFLRILGHVHFRLRLLSRLWGYDFDSGTNVVDVYIRYLRNKVEPETMETVRRAAYRLT